MNNQYLSVARPQTLLPFEEMESYLRTDYLMLKSRESQTRKIEALMKNYEIVVEGAGKER
jgi:hypothetical protein